MWLDVRYALRMMVKAPGLTAVLAITLALGIGASTTIFSVIHSVLIRPLPYDRPEQLVRIYTEEHGGGKPSIERHKLTGGEYRDLRDSCRSCAAVAAWNTGMMTIGGGDRPVYVDTALATHQLGPLLGVQPLLGRWFDASEDPKTGGPGPLGRKVIVLGYGLWQRAFAGDPAVVGRMITLEGHPIRVVGVMPPGFDFLGGPEAWIPFGRDVAAAAGNQHYLNVIVRLEPGVSIDAFRDELGALSAQWAAAAGPADHAITPANPWLRSHPMTAEPFHADVVGSLATTLWLLQGAALIVLLISVVNIANLVLARSIGRTREVAVRHALGASRRRLIRQFMTESLLLGTVGGALGILAAMWGIDGVTALIPRSAPRAGDIALDGSAVAFAVACTIAASLLFGIAPIVHARKTDLHGALKEGSTHATAGAARLRIRRALVIVELALAVVLVVGCAVMVRAFVALQRVDLGFRPDHLLTVKVRLPYAAFPDGTGNALWARLQDRLRALPGVTGVTLLDELPPNGRLEAVEIDLPGRIAAPGEIWTVDHRQFVGGDFTATLGARIAAGRDFLPSDADNAPLVALINEAFARRYFPGEDPIGQRVKLYTPPATLPQYQTIVGVVADIKQHGIDRPARTEGFLPMRQLPAYDDRPVHKSHSYVAIRTARAPAGYEAAVTRAIAELDPNVALARLRTMDDLLWEAVARPRFLTFLLGCFAAVALVLAAVGIYGVMAHTVAQRTHELGLRIALGAQPAHVRALVLRDAGRLMAAGVATGVGAALALQLALDGSLRGLFYGERLTEPVLLGGVALAVAATALLATWIPARRATEVEPTVALRSD